MGGVHVLNGKTEEKYPDVLKEGTDVTLIGKLRVNLSPTSHIVKWYKDGSQINEKASIQDKRMQISANSNLIKKNCGKCEKPLNNHINENEYPICSQLPYYIYEHKLTIKDVMLYDIGENFELIIIQLKIL